MSNDLPQRKSLDDPITWKESGNDFFNKGQYEEAIKCYSHAIALNPDFIDAWNNMGLALLKIGNIDEAKKCNEKVKELKDNQKLQPQEAQKQNGIENTEIGADAIKPTKIMGSTSGEKPGDIPICPNCHNDLPYKPSEWPRGVPRYCPNCGFRINDIKNIEIEKSYKNPRHAAILSIIPGLGQIYNGAALRGILFLIGTLLGLLLIIPGMIIWIFGIYDSYQYANKINKGDIIGKNERKLVIVIFGVISFIIFLSMISYIAYSTTPEYAVQDYVSAWNNRDYDKLYNYLSGNAKNGISKTAVHGYVNIGSRVADYSITSKMVDSNTATISVNMDIITQGVLLQNQKTFNLVHEGGGWKISKFVNLVA